VHLGPFTIAKTLVRASVPSLALAPWAAGQNAEISLFVVALYKEPRQVQHPIYGT